MPRPTMCRVVGHSDDEVEDYVLCEKAEKVVSVHETLEALFDDAEKRVQGTEVFNVSYQWRTSSLDVASLMRGTPSLM